MFIRTNQLNSQEYILWVYSESVEENHEFTKIKEFISQEYLVGTYLFHSLSKPDLLQVLAYFQTEHELEQASAEIVMKFF